MNNYGIFKKWDWCYIKFDGRKKIFRGMTKAEFAAAKDRHFAHQRARYGSAPEGRCKSLETVGFLKKYVNTNYEKIIIEGNEHLYIASPIYRHGDYNKCIFSENTPKNRRKAELVNKLLEKARNNSVNG